MEKKEMLDALAEAMGLSPADMAFIDQKEAELNDKANELREIFASTNTPLAVKEGENTFINVMWLNQIVQEVATQGIMGKNVPGVAIAEMLSFSVTAALAEVDTDA